MRKRGPKKSRSSTQSRSLSDLSNGDIQLHAQEDQDVERFHGHSHHSGAIPESPSLPRFIIGDSAEGHETSPMWRLHKQLCTDFGTQSPLVTIADMVNECIAFCFQRSFPTFPIFHESSIRASAKHFFGSIDDNRVGKSSSFDNNPALNDIALMRSFTVITGLCATMSFIHQKTLLPRGASVGPLFFRISREMLKYYEEYDIQHPDSTSLQIRMLFSTCFQYMGKNNLAWYTVGTAGLLARNMRLYSEVVLSKYDPLESTVLRMAFWTLYTADRSAICMQNRAITLHEPLFDSVMDISTFGSNQALLLDPSYTGNRTEFENSLLSGFHFVRGIWCSAAQLMLAIRSRAPSPTSETMNAIGKVEMSQFMQMYLEFSRYLDHMPSFLRSFNRLSNQDEDLSPYQISCYTTLRFRALTTFYCLKLMIMYQSIQNGMTDAIGLRNDELTLTMEETNTARDFVQILESTPFRYVQASGEPGVSLPKV